MPIPMSSDYYLEPLERLLADLTPEQQGKLADWIIMVSHYGRELTVNVGLANVINEQFLKDWKPARRENAVKLDKVREGSDSIVKHSDHLRQMFDDLQNTVTRYSWLQRDTEH